jgi:biotin synthase-like enzyme
MKDIWFERAIFISWFCAKPTCKFCYMYTIRDRIKAPNKARRRLSSILAEAAICRQYNWKIGFISSGIFAFRTAEISEILEKVCKIAGYRQWLNIGTLKEEQIIALKPYIEGICGTVECINEDIRRDLVPDKPLSEITKMFKLCDEYGLKKGITIIIGLGETLDDFDRLKVFIENHKVDRINYYRLVPHEGGAINQGPATEYYAEWISMTRKAFPRLEIIAGSWPDRVDEVDRLIESGADAITKFPAIKLFNSAQAKIIKEKVERTGNRFISNFTKYEDIGFELPLEQPLKDQTIASINRYLRKMRNAKKDEAPEHIL